MKEKEHVSKYGATCATTLHLTTDFHGTGGIVIADSWFGSVKTAVALKQSGLYSIMIVKTAHKRFPREALDSHDLEIGEWVAYNATFDDVKLQVVSFQDIKKKQFISTCSTILPGNPRKTRYLGEVSHPKVAEFYLNHVAAIDMDNHIRTGSMGLEDAILTKSPHIRQFTGILGFLFTNAYLAYRYFKPTQSSLEHVNFEMALSNQLIEFKEILRAPSLIKRGLIQPIGDMSLLASSRIPVKLPYPKP